MSTTTQAKQFAEATQQRVREAQEASAKAKAKFEEAQRAASEGALGDNARKLKERAERLRQEAKKAADAAREVSISPHALRLPSTHRDGVGFCALTCSGRR